MPDDFFAHRPSYAKPFGGNEEGPELKLPSENQLKTPIVAPSTNTRTAEKPEETTGQKFVTWG